MMCDSDKLTFNTLHVVQETLEKMGLQWWDFVFLFRNICDMKTFVLVFCDWNLFQPAIGKNRHRDEKS